MIVFDVELLHGTYRADPDGSAATGQHTRGEWPPAPSRLLAALISAGDPDVAESAGGVELETLASAAPPIICADSGAAVHHQRLLERAVAGQQRKNNQHQEYPARVGVIVRPGTRVAPRSPRVWFCYDLDVADDMLDRLRWRAARVGYLGCADSPVKLTVARRDMPPGSAMWVPDPDGSQVVNTHQAGDPQRWRAAFDAWRDHGITRRQMIRHQHKTLYRPPHEPLPEMGTGRVLAMVRFAVPPAGRRAVLVAHSLKQATISNLDAMGFAVPEWVHGHVGGSDDYQLARFLSLPFAGHPRGNGRISAAAVWAPADAPADEARMLAQAVHAISLLRLADGTVLRVDRAGRSWTASARRWLGPARRWTTVLPAVSDRHPRIDSTAVARWCEQAGLPRPEDSVVSRTPLLPGAVDLHPFETRRPGHTQNRPHAHVSVLFAEAVQGPVVIGAARSYGLGLCAPDDPSPDSQSEH